MINENVLSSLQGSARILRPAVRDSWLEVRAAEAFLAKVLVQLHVEAVLLGIDVNDLPKRTREIRE